MPPAKKLPGSVDIVPLTLSPLKGRWCRRWFDKPVLSSGEGVTTSGCEIGCRQSRIDSIRG